ncbi:glycosyltransferase family 4 protein [Selenomonas sp. KH1T6]|uniref:glycosyltransferase family 4 protein n=1 Tax=Selenomonas sp. KH1T6 TaxID=3158784 RepID=UPI0008A7E817|nr:Glycosyl transferases group 1 [Selenomonas ruminantium]
MSEKQHKTIYINGKFLAQRLSGVQRCATEIVKALDEIAPGLPYEIVLLTPRRVMGRLALKHIAVRDCGHLQGTLWEQMELPFHASDGCLMNLCNCAPLFKARQAVILHDVSFMAVPQAYGCCYRLWHRLMSWVLGRRLPQILTDSYFSKGELERYLAISSEKISVVYLGTEHMQKIVPDEGTMTELGLMEGSYVLAVSSQSLHKNFSLVLQAAELLPEVKFVIAGQQNPAVFKTAGFDEAPGNVVFTGYVDDSRLAALYKYAGCFVYPSLYEGFGLPPLEAMSYGTPVIAARAASLPEVLEEAALYIDPHDEKELVGAIIALMEDAELRERLIARGAEQCRKYSWHSTAEQIMERMVRIIC